MYATPFGQHFHSDRKAIMSFKAEIQFPFQGGKVWRSNSMRFDTKREAEDFGFWLRPDLPSRAVETTDAVTRKWVTA